MTPCDPLPVYGVVALSQISAHTPRLLAWGSMFDLPRRDSLYLMVELADMLPPRIHHQELDYLDTDYLVDAIAQYHEDRVLPQDGEWDYEALLIHQAVSLRRLLGPTIGECHLIDIRASQWLILEMQHAHHPLAY